MEKIRLLAILILFSSLFSCAAKPKPLVKIVPPHFVGVSGDYQKINSVQELPNVISDYFSKERFGADMVGPESSEFSSSRGTKLISAGNSGEIWFIEFLMGGTGLSQSFLAFRVKEKRILSILEIDPTKIYPKPFLQLTIDELQNKLPTQPVCVKKRENYLQYIYETGYGICPDQY
jgi:hypothetical protein